MPERDSSKAIQIRDNHIAGNYRIVCPLLLLYELTNVLKCYATEHGAPLTTFEVMLKYLFDLDILFVVPRLEHLRQALTIAASLKLTVYDAIYVVTAQEMHLTLLTADRKLFENAQRVCQVVLLQDLS